jgi:hypothetical protein
MSLPSDEKADIITFYHTFANNSTQFGIRLLPLQDVRPDGTNCCPPDVLPFDRQAMSKAIYTKLSDGEVLPRTTSPRIRGILQQFAHDHDGYAVLYNVLRLVHPLLNDTNVDHHTLPQWSLTKDPFLHAGAVAHYFEMEHSMGRVYTEREKTLLYLRTVSDPQPIYGTTIDRLREKLMASPTVDLAQTPNLLLVNIPHQLMALPPPTADVDPNPSAPYHIHALSHASPRDRSSDRRDRRPRDQRTGPCSDSDRGIRSNRVACQCDGCKTWGHKVGDCHHLARVSFILQYLKNKPDMAQKIAADYAHQHSKQMRQATARVLAQAESLDASTLDDLLVSDFVSDFDFTSTLDPTDF